ncbi:unnamed protein product [Durusdinium trenchii]|uniref:Uncharacterized protein n=1 Tax=Durusdinium trenchii TaxID=1381693 RepID=A0ABP0MES9_9DINO
MEFRWILPVSAGGLVTDHRATMSFSLQDSLTDLEKRSAPLRALESRRRARSCDVHHSLYNKGLERMARHAEQVQQQSKERSARQVLGRSREYYWQMLDRQIRDAFDKAAKGHHLANTELEDFLRHFGVMATNEASSTLAVERINEESRKLRTALWRHLDPDGVRAPAVRRERLPPKMRPEDAAKVVAQKARPFLDSFLKLVEANVEGERVVDEAKLMASNLGSLAWARRAEKPALQSQLPVIFVLGLLAMLYSAFVFAYMPAAGLSLNSTESLLFHAFVFLTLASFAQAARTDPGDVPAVPSGVTAISHPGGPDTPEEWEEMKRWRGTLVPEVAGGALARRAVPQEKRWKKAEQMAFKPDRAHFCRAMGRVVACFAWTTIAHGLAIPWAYTNMACGMLGLNVLDLLVHALTTFLLIGTEALTFLLSSILVRLRMERAVERSVERQSRMVVQPCGVPDLTTIEFCASFARGPDEKWAPVGGPSGNGIFFPRKGAERRKARAERVPEHFVISDENEDMACEDAAIIDGQQVWVDAAEFTDDLKVGCEVILETAEDAYLSAWRLLATRSGIWGGDSMAGWTLMELEHALRVGVGLSFTEER